MARTLVPPRYRLGVALRAVAAIAGGYALAALFSVACTLLLARATAMGRAEAVLTSTLAAIVVFVLAVLWVFAVRSARRAWAGLLLAAAPLAILAFALRGGA